MTLIRDQFHKVLHQDGQDHVNLSVHGKTEIGQIASPEYRKRFYIPHLGEFASARCFANWMCSGGDDSLRTSSSRYNTAGTSVSVFRMYLLFAKHFQITSLRNTCVSNSNMLNVPWVMYKQHITGVREFDRWSIYSEIAKVLVMHAVDNTANVKFNWDLIDGQIPLVVQERIRQIAEASGTPAEAVVDITRADEVAKHRKIERREHQRAERDALKNQPAQEQEVDEKTAQPEPAEQGASEVGAEAQPEASA